MPTSHPSLISPVAQKILALQPKTVLDLGVGFGKWGAMAREYTDIWSWRFYPAEYQTVIHGVEAHEKYESANWGHYQKIFLGKIQEVLPTLGGYDLITFLEVLEHFEKREGIAVLEECLRHTDRLLVSFTNTHQHDVRDNKLEDHLSTWELRDFTRLSVEHVEVLHQTPEGGLLYLSRTLAK